MDRSALIARKMIRNWQFVVAKKNKVKSVGRNPFEGWTTRTSPIRNETEREADEQLATAACAFLRRAPYAYIVGCQLDQGKKAWKAWRGPYQIATALGLKTLRPSDLMDIHVGTLTAVLRHARLGCVQLSHAKAARFLRDGARITYDAFGDNAARMWDSARTLDELVERWDALPGIGVGIRNMAIKFNFEFGMVPRIAKSAAVLSSLGVKADTHVRHVFFRTGLASSTSKADAMAAAEEYAPSCPAALDQAGFAIGMLHCSKKDASCAECPLAFKSTGERLCPRRRR